MPAIQHRRPIAWVPAAICLIGSLGAGAAMAADPSLPEHSAAETSADALAAPADTPPTESAQRTTDSAAPRRVGNLEIEPVHFNGIQLGSSTIEEVQQAWGDPVSVRPGDPTIEYVYHIEPFRQVELSFHQGKVVSLMISLNERFPPGEVARQLGLTDYEPVTVRDQQGAPLGQAWPERGVIFTYVGGASKPQVAQIVLELIDPQPFVLRAQERLKQHYTGCLDDLNTALQLDPEYARAWWLKAQLLARLGRRGDALEACRKAVEIDSRVPEFQLWLGRLLAATGNFDLALHHTREALSLAGDQPEVRARALLQQGDLLAAGPQRDFQQAIDFHLQAIRVAEPLAADARVAVRRAAKEVLIDAHLAVANDIAWGDWQNKAEVVNRWLQRATKLAHETIANDQLHADYQWRVHQQALAAHVGLRGELDPKPWAEELLRVVRERIDETSDPLRRRHLEWELGIGLYDALQTYHARGTASPALEYGALAVNYLERGLVGRQEAPGDAYLMGRLYFRIGWVYAVQKQDHRAALAWFNRAAPLVERKIPESALADCGRQGETLVSMAVTYWSVGQRSRALELTRRGMELMQSAVRQGIMSEQALAVPYSNLATMHGQLGEEDKARNFTELAERYHTTGTIQR